MATPPRRPSLQRNAPLQTLAQSSSTAALPSSSNHSTTTSPTTTTSSTATTLPSFTYTTSSSVSPTRPSTFSAATATIPALDNSNPLTHTRSRYNSLPSLSPPAVALSAPAVPTMAATPRTSVAFGSGESWTLQSGSGFGFNMDVGMGSLTPQDMMMMDGMGMMTPRRGATVVGWAVDADGDALMMDVF